MADGEQIVSERHQIVRVRREPKRRTVTVAAREQLSPNLLRLRFASDDFADFDSAAPDDHIKLFFPTGDGGAAMRDYTPRAFDARAGTLTIDFAVHEAGPATAWALAAKPGDTLAIGGPRGSAVVPDDFDWYLLIADETGIPAVARRLEELRPDAPVITAIAIDDAGDRAALPARAGVTALWHVRDESGADDASGLIAALAAQPLPAGEGYVWIAAEASVARALRAHVLDTLGHPRAWFKASGYWHKGVAGEHVKFGD